MKIEIEKSDIGWKVIAGDRYEDGLDSGEALWCVANILVRPSGDTVPFLRTAEQHAAWDAKFAPKLPLKEWQKTLPAGGQP